jgi:PilZ domain-containing protein
MQTKNRRAPRHLLGGAVEVTDSESEKQIVTLARNLSLFGCFVATATPFVMGTKVRVRITHRSATFAALGWVAYSSGSEGMGLRLAELKLKTEQSSTPGWENSLDGWHWPMTP